ncbi:MAG: glycosyltransferase [Chitinophagaceae bacterium]|nr:glycosyltransferase [Chitinophagaceae bacterium]
MKIGFLGNTNNYPFIIAMKLQEMGCEVVLFIDAPAHETLHRPEHYTDKIKYPYPAWIKERHKLRNALFIHFPNIFLRNVIKELNTCDAVILNDYGHRFKNFIKPDVLSISIFSGADLEVMADYDQVLQMKMASPKLWFMLPFIKKMYARFSVDQLRKGISKASLVSYFPAGIVPNDDKYLNEIFPAGNCPRFNHFHVITEDFKYMEPPDNEIFRIFSFTRFIWKMPFPPGVPMNSNKGNDIMLKGIALFLKDYDQPLDIHFIEKGLHVQESKELIESLGFSHMVTWHKEMPFKELQGHIGKADVVLEQIGTHFISGGLYAMLKGRPLIGNARPEIFDPLLQEKTAICHALTPEDVCGWLQKLTTDKSLLHEMGIRSREYVLKHFDINNETKYFFNFIEERINKKHV